MASIIAGIFLGLVAALWSYALSPTITLTEAAMIYWIVGVTAPFLHLSLVICAPGGTAPTDRA